MLDRNRMIEMHLQILAELGWKPATGDVIDQMNAGGVLTAQQAALVCETTDQTIRRWCEEAASKGQPLGVKVVTWLIGRTRLLDYIEKQDGLPARVKAENLLKYYWPIWSRSSGQDQQDGRSRAARRIPPTG